MQVKLNLEPRGRRLLMGCLGGLLSALLAAQALIHFTISAIADPGADVARELVEAAINYFPNSSALHARLAAKLVEARVDESQNHEQIAALAEQHARRAISLLPARFDNYVLLGVAAELQGDWPGAEAALRQALALAPHRLSLHWRLGNLFLRQGKLAEASTELRQVVAADPSYLPEALDLLWQATDGEVAALQAVAGADQRNQLVLANFLAGRQQYEAAAESLATLDKQTPTPAPQLGVGEALDKLIAAGKIELAAKVWQRLWAGEAKWGAGAIWNGGLEAAPQKGLTQFDWNLSSNAHVRIGIAADNAHSGRHALKLAYLGKETTRLEGEVRQLVLVQPGKKYQLECYVKTEALVSPDGPHLAILRADDKALIAASPSVASGARDWQPLRLAFNAPADVSAVLLAIKQTPRFSYTAPTSGAVWFDDFRLSEP